MANLVPAIVFKVDLSKQPAPSFLSPNAYQTNPDLGHQNDTNQVATRISWIPGLMDAENVNHGNGYQFTLYGMKAQYYYSEIAKGNFPMLSVVSVS